MKLEVLRLFDLSMTPGFKSQVPLRRQEFSLFWYSYMHSNPYGAPMPAAGAELKVRALHQDVIDGVNTCCLNLYLVELIGQCFLFIV